MTPIEDLPTPAVLIDLDILERNVAQMQERAREARRAPAVPRQDAQVPGGLVGTRSRLERLSEEHGVIRVEEGERFRVGQKVRILPNHACAVSNLHDRLVAVRGGRVDGEIRVAARGRVQ